METIENKKEERKFPQSITMKGIIVFVLTLILLIPGEMVQDLIRERKSRSIETVNKINDKWSNAQTICGPVLTIPYSLVFVEKNKQTTEQHELHLFPETLNMKTQLHPEVKYYGIYKTILYKSDIRVSGKFEKKNLVSDENVIYHFDKATIAIGVSDLRGVTNQIDFNINGKTYQADAGGRDSNFGDKLVFQLNDLLKKSEMEELSFDCNLNLNGSSCINFIPVGKNTQVSVDGAWTSPGFVGSFSPESQITNDGFSATWNILHFNRNIPEFYNDNNVDSFYDASFGVNLVDTVDHYQQNTRAAKYALMFIALTFVVFFFVELITKRKIHPIQYLLVGIALILFYSLLLSISEQINFGIAYLIASIATVGLIGGYASSIFKNKKQTATLTVMLCSLYTFLYVILQLEDVALLIGSIGLFVILGIIMYFSRKITWYKEIKEEEK